MNDYKNQKVIGIGIVRGLTGLSERKIRYYEERGLIFPEKTPGGTRLYSFNDIEKLAEIQHSLHKGISTYDIRQKVRKENPDVFRRKMIQGQINGFFNKKTP